MVSIVLRDLTAAPPSSSYVMSSVYHVSTRTAAIAPSPRRPSFLDNDAWVYSPGCLSFDNAVETSLAQGTERRLERSNARTHTTADCANSNQLRLASMIDSAQRLASSPNYPQTPISRNDPRRYLVHQMSSPSLRTEQQTEPASIVRRNHRSVASRGWPETEDVMPTADTCFGFRHPRSFTVSSALSSSFVPQQVLNSTALSQTQRYNGSLRRAQTTVASTGSSDSSRQLQSGIQCQSCGSLISYANGRRHDALSYGCNTASYRAGLFHSISSIRYSTRTCITCRRSGTVDTTTSSATLYAILRRVIAFYRTVLNLELLPLFHKAAIAHRLFSRNSHTARLASLSEAAITAMDGPTRDRTLQEALAIELVDLSFFEANADRCSDSCSLMATCGDMQQLARCECRSAIRTSTQAELGRWTEKIFVVSGLAFEAFGGILAHEFMHAYMWLSRAEGATREFDEAVCNLAAMKFLETEASLIAKARERGDRRREVEQRQVVCKFRIGKLRELQLSESRYATELQRAQQLLDAHNGSFAALVATQRREAAEVISRAATEL